MQKTPPPTTYGLDSNAHARKVVRALEQQFRLQRLGRSRFEVTYLDTFDWRLFERQLALSATQVNGGVRLKLESIAGTVEDEAEVPTLPTFADSLPAGQIRTRLEPIIEVRRLLEKAHDDTQVIKLRSVDAREKTVVRLEVEHHSFDPAAANGGVPPQISLRVRPVKGYAARHRELIEFIETTLGLKRVAQTSVASSLASLSRADRASRSKLSVTLRPELDAGQAVRLILKNLLEMMRANEPGVRAQIDSEFLHDFRVALRQTRSALDLLDQALPPEPLNYFRAEFKWLGDRTGAVRDLDVFLLTLAEYHAALGGDREQTLAPLEEHLHRSHGQLRRQMLAALDSNRYRELLRRWGEFLDAQDDAGPVSALARQPVVAFAGARIRWGCRRTRKHGRAIDANSPARALHRLRIDCKKLRYLLEFFSSLYAVDDVGGFIKPLKRLQDNLGTFNDLYVQEHELLRFADELGARRPAPVECFLTMGRLVALLQVRAQDERRRFDRRFADFGKATRRSRVQALLDGHPRS